jgi:hypothetical protein
VLDFQTPVLLELIWLPYNSLDQQSLRVGCQLSFRVKETALHHDSSVVVNRLDFALVRDSYIQTLCAPCIQNAFVVSRSEGSVFVHKTHWSTTGLRTLGHRKPVSLGRVFAEVTLGGIEVSMCVDLVDFGIARKYAYVLRVTKLKQQGGMRFERDRCTFSERHGAESLTEL